VSGHVRQLRSLCRPGVTVACTRIVDRRKLEPRNFDIPLPHPADDSLMLDGAGEILEGTQTNFGCTVVRKHAPGGGGGTGDGDGCGVHAPLHCTTKRKNASL
jgi:hypothetical protein